MRNGRTRVRCSKKEAAGIKTGGSMLAIKPKTVDTPTSQVEVDFSPEEVDEIREKFAPAFYFSQFRGRRISFGMKSGEIITGDVGMQRWQFLQLSNVVVETKDGSKKSIRSRMINVDRIEYFDFVDESDQ